MKSSFFSIVAVALLLAACQNVGTTGYTAYAVNASGQNVGKQAPMKSNQAGVEMSVQTVCQSNKAARAVVVKNALGVEIQGSPFKCR